MARRKSTSGVAVAARLQAGVNLFLQQLVRHLAVELAVEPVDQAAGLGALGAVARQQRKRPSSSAPRAPAACLGQVLGDGVNAAQGRAALELQHGQLAGRVKGQKLRPPLPRALLDELHLDVLLGEREAHGAREGAEPELCQRVHCLM